MRKKATKSRDTIFYDRKLNNKKFTEAEQHEEVVVFNY